MADVKKLPYNAQNPKKDALIRAGLMEEAGSHAAAEPKKHEGAKQAP